MRDQPLKRGRPRPNQTPWHDPGHPCHSFENEYWRAEKEKKGKEKYRNNSDFKLAKSKNISLNKDMKLS